MASRALRACGGVVALVLIGGMLGCKKDAARNKKKVAEVDCSGTEEDGVIAVPDECPSLIEAARIADDSGPGITILLAEDVVLDEPLELLNNTTLRGDTSPSPSITTNSLYVTDSTVQTVDVDCSFFELSSATLESVSIAGDGSMWGATVLTDVAIGGQVSGGGGNLTMTNTQAPGLSLDFSGGEEDLAIDVLDSLLAELTVERNANAIMNGATVTLDGTTVVGQVELTVGVNTTLEFQATDTSLGSLLATAYDGATATISLVRTIIVAEDDAVVLQATGWDTGGLVQFDAVASYFYAPPDYRVLGLAHNDGDWGFNGDFQVDLTNNVLAGGQFHVSQSRNCSGGDADSDLELLLRNNIFVGVDFVMFLEALTATLDSSYNMFWDSDPSGLWGHDYYSGGICYGSGQETDLDLLQETGSFTADPLFVAYDASSPDAADLRLSDGSPAVDAGDPSAAFRDVDGSTNDMGCFGGPMAME